MAETKKLSRWDLADHIHTPAEVGAYLQTAFDDGDPRLIAAMTGAVARSKGMQTLASKTGLAREALYRSLSEAGNPSFATMLAVLREFGLRLQVAEIACAAPTPKRAALRGSKPSKKTVKRPAPA